MPKLPWDVLLVVFSLSDAPTLAVLGRVSLDFLEATSPLLYTEVEVTSFEALEGFFSKRSKSETSSLPSRINHLLDLSQLRVLSLDFTSPPSPIPESLTLSSSRFGGGLDVLPLDSVRMFFESRVILPLLHSDLLPLLNPIHLQYTAERPQMGLAAANVTLSTPILSHYSRIREVELKGILLFKVEQLEPGIPHSYHLVCLPTPSIYVRRVVRLHLSSLLYKRHPDPASYLRFLSSQASPLFPESQMQDGSIVLVVGSEGEREEVDVAVRGLQEVWRAKFAVELQPCVSSTRRFV